MNYTQILFSNRTGSEHRGAPVRYFEAVADEYASEPFKPGDSGAERKRFFADASREKSLLVSTSEQALRPAPLRPAARESREDLSYTLLFYLDQIVYLEEIAENLAKLDAAIESGNAAAVSLAANDCAGLGARCGMLAALKPLRELERVRHASQMLKAESLSREVCREFEAFKLILKENLEQMTAVDYEL